MSEERDPKKYIQSVVVELSDGRKGVFSGPPLVWAEKNLEGTDHELRDVSIKKIFFHEPKLMREGARWGRSQEEAFQQNGNTPEKTTIDTSNSLRLRIQDKLKERVG